MNLWIVTEMGPPRNTSTPIPRHLTSIRVSLKRQQMVLISNSGGAFHRTLR
jgi:hypothetical protein